MNKNFKKLIAMGLTAIMAATSMSVLAVDNNNEAVYTYTQDGQEVNITQADLDAGHWDKDALGDLLPFVYEDFPMLVDDFVDDYSDLTLNMNYLKKLDSADNVTLKITDLYNDSIVYEKVLDKHSVSLSNVEMNKAYKLILSETFDGITKEYYKAVTTSVEQAQMPSYVKNSDTTDETIVLVGDLDNLRASTSINDEGEIEIDTDMPRYEKVKACDLAEYISNLPSNKCRVLRCITGKALMHQRHMLIH